MFGLLSYILCLFTACRRQGYFHDTIGDVIKDTYRDTADHGTYNIETIAFYSSLCKLISHSCYVLFLLLLLLLLYLMLDWHN